MAADSGLMNNMKRAARGAARGLLRDFNEVSQLQVSRKGPADFVSQADIRAEQKLVELLQKTRPDALFIGEESGQVAALEPEEGSTALWIVDPLDGTTNFLHGIPHWAISIAFFEDRQVQAAVVYDPIKDEMFSAERGRGAYLNDKPVHLSKRTKMADCVFSTGIPFLGRGDHAAFLGELSKVMAVSAGVRRMGAAALDLAYVAAGRYDGFWERGLSRWDIAAGILLVREAGGVVTDFEGNSDNALRGDVIASPHQLHEELHKILC